MNHGRTSTTWILAATLIVFYAYGSSCSSILGYDRAKDLIERSEHFNRAEFLQAGVETECGVWEDLLSLTSLDPPHLTPKAIQHFSSRGFLDYEVHPPDGSIVGTISGNQIKGTVREEPRPARCNRTGRFEAAALSEGTGSPAEEAGVKVTPRTGFVGEVRSSEGDLLYIPSHQGLGVIELNLAQDGARRTAKTVLFNNTLVVWNAQRKEFYVAASNGGEVSVLQAEPFREIATMREDVGWNTQSMVLSRTGNSLYLGCSTGGPEPSARVVSFDTAVRSRVATVFLTNTHEAVFLALSPDGRRLYVSWSSHLDVYEAPGLRLLQRQTYEGWYSSPLALSSDGLFLFLVQGGRLLRWRTDARTIEASFPLPEPEVARFDFRVSRDGSAVLVPGQQAIYRIPTSMDGYSSIRPPRPSTVWHFRFAESSDGRALYVLSGDNGEESLWVIDFATQRVTQTVPAIPYPASVLVVAKATVKLAQQAGAGSRVASSARTACANATDLGYSLSAGGHAYRVKGIASPSGGQVHVFFDEKGIPVQDPVLLEKLALGAWARENIVALPDSRNGSRRVDGILGTSQSIHRYEMAQDILAQALAAALEAVVTGGISLNKSVSGLAWGFVKSQLANAGSARTLFILSAQVGLRESLGKYKQLEETLEHMDDTILDVTTLQKVKELYTQARALELPNVALVVAFMPKSFNELTNQTLQSMLNELVSSLPPDPNEVVTLKGLLNLQETLAVLGDSLPVLKAYSENLRLVTNLAPLNDRKIAEMAQQSARAASTCAERTASSSWEARWRGELKTPSPPYEKNTPVVMTLKKDGTRLIGMVNEGWPSCESVGEVTESGVFHLDSDGVVWEGRFESPERISGVRDPGHQAWPFFLNRVEILPPGSVTLPKAAGPTSSDWKIFFARFKVAVQKRDRAALIVMMSPCFQYDNGLPVSPDKAFSRELDDMTSPVWKDLESTIALGTLPGKPSNFGRSTRLAINRSPCPGCKYQVWVGFELDDDKQWRWASLIFPGD